MVWFNCITAFRRILDDASRTGTFRLMSVLQHSEPAADAKNRNILRWTPLEYAMADKYISDEIKELLVAAGAIRKH